MGRTSLGLLLSRRREQFKRLVEISDLTGQLIQAAQRHDQVSMQMLLSMREEPLKQLQEIELGIQKILLTLPVQEAIRCQELLNGAEAEFEEELPLYELNARCRRLLQSSREMDKRLSLNICGSHSFYRTFREPESKPTT